MHPSGYFFECRARLHRKPREGFWPSWMRGRTKLHDEGTDSLFAPRSDPGHTGLRRNISSLLVFPLRWKTGQLYTKIIRAQKSFPLQINWFPFLKILKMTRLRLRDSDTSRIMGLRIKNISSLTHSRGIPNAFIQKAGNEVGVCMLTLL